MIAFLLPLFAIISCAFAAPSSAPTFMLETIYQDNSCSSNSIYGYHAIQTDCSLPKWNIEGCVNGSVWSCTRDPDGFIDSLDQPFIAAYEISSDDAPAPPFQLSDYDEINYYLFNGTCLTRGDFGAVFNLNPETGGIKVKLYVATNCTGIPFFDTENSDGVSADYVSHEKNRYKLINNNAFYSFNFTSQSFAHI